LWGRAARDWVEIQEPNERVLWEAALRGVRAERGKRLLDAGCGGGGACVMAAEQGLDVFGIDPSIPMLTIARERLPMADLRPGEIEDLPFSNGMFDCVIAANSVQFSSDPKLAVHELGRVCRNGGRLAVVVFDAPEQCEMRHVFQAVLDLFESPPSGRGPFALSYPGALESLFVSPSIESIEPVECRFEYPSMDAAVRGMLSAGPSQRAIEIHGEERVSQAIRNALESSRQQDGRIVMRNRFRCAIARCG
jgi:SAM-dependent methyltransferase